jgi:hypothetical protein
MELWLFDRSGMYDCEVFDISKSPRRCLTVLVSYAPMSDTELVDTQIAKDSLEKYILCGGDDEAGAEKLYVEDMPIFKRQNKDIMSDGLACYRARTSRRWEFVVNMKGAARNNATEAKML